MTLGMWIDFIIEWNNINNPEQENEKREVTRRATQSDFDRF
jgi:hypothetical protein